MIIKAISCCQNEIVKSRITYGQNYEIENKQKTVDEVKKFYFVILKTHEKLFPPPENGDKKVLLLLISENPLIQNVQPQIK